MRNKLLNLLLALAMLCGLAITATGIYVMLSLKDAKVQALQKPQEPQKVIIEQQTKITETKEQE